MQIERWWYIITGRVKRNRCNSENLGHQMFGITYVDDGVIRKIRGHGV